MRRGIAVLKSFVGAIKVTVGDIDIGMDIEPEPGAADSGDLGVDLPSLFAAMGEAAQERGVMSQTSWTSKSISWGQCVPA